MNDNLDHLEDQFPPENELILNNTQEELNQLTKKHYKLTNIALRQLAYAREEADSLLDLINTSTQINDVVISRIRLISAADILSEKHLLVELKNLSKSNEQVRSYVAKYLERKESA